MRLIDADALIQSTDKESVHMYQIALAPTVDAVPVVRCKNCRFYHIYWESNGYTEKGYGACDWINDNSVREDHFCSWGERREDGKDD